jgi:hypothetical protein
VGIRGWVVGVGIVVGLGCSGLPIPTELPELPGTEEEAAEIRPEIAELVAAEDPEGALSDEDRAARAASLELFVTVNPDFDTWRPILLDRIEGTEEKVEAAYAGVKADFADKPPVEVEVTDEQQRVVAIVTRAYDTTEDWAFFTNDVAEAMKARKVPVVLAGPGVQELSLRKDGKEVGTVDLAPLVMPPQLLVGYVFSRKGQEPMFQAHEQPEHVIASADAYLGTLGVEDEDDEEDAGDAVAARPRPAPAPVPEAEPEPEPEPAPAPAPVAAPKPRTPLPDLDPEPVADPKGKAGKSGKRK